MSARMKISYTEYGELDLIVKGLSVVTGSVRVKEKPPKGRFKRAYIEMHTFTKQTKDSRASEPRGAHE